MAFLDIVQHTEKQSLLRFGRPYLRGDLAIEMTSSVHTTMPSTVLPSAQPTPRPSVQPTPEPSVQPTYKPSAHSTKTARPTAKLTQNKTLAAQNGPQLQQVQPVINVLHPVLPTNATLVGPKQTNVIGKKPTKTTTVVSKKPANATIVIVHATTVGKNPANATTVVAKNPINVTTVVSKQKQP